MLIVLKIKYEYNILILSLLSNNSYKLIKL